MTEQKYDSELVAAETARLFGGDADELAEARRLLDEIRPTGDMNTVTGRARIHYAVLKLSGNSLLRLRHNVEQAKIDYRDVLYWAGV